MIRSGVALGVDADYRRVLPVVGRDASAEFVEVPMTGHHRPDRLREEAGELGTLAETYGLEIAVDLPLAADLAAPAEPVRRGSRELCQDALEVAAAVDASKAVLVPRTGTPRAAYDDVELQGRFVELALDLDSYADHAGLELCVTPAPLLPLSEMDPLVGRDVSLCLDVPRARRSGLDPDRLRERRDAVSHVSLDGVPGADGPDGHKSVDRNVDAETETYVRALGHDWEGTVAFGAGEGPGAVPERLAAGP